VLCHRIKGGEPSSGPDLLDQGEGKFFSPVRRKGQTHGTQKKGEESFDVLAPTSGPKGNPFYGKSNHVERSVDVVGRQTAALSSEGGKSSMYGQEELLSMAMKKKEYLTSAKKKRQGQKQPAHGIAGVERRDNKACRGEEKRNIDW